MRIRPAVESDLAALAAISEASDSAAHWTPQQWLDIFRTQSPQRLAWIAEDSAADRAHPCAFLIALNGGSEWELENLAVLDEFRRRGIARELVATLVAHARSLAAERIFLEVRASNAPALQLYETCGFQAIGLRRAYYDNPPEDALILVHQL
jgi:ribosomal protein S18 acetylase RimI-like enzyme